MLIREVKTFIYLILTVIFLSSCSTIGGVIQERAKKPEVDFLGARLDKLSFDSISLLFDLRVRNPNSLGLKLAGFNYDFLINGVSFIKGNQEKNLEIEAKGESTIQIPVSFGFLDFYDAFQSLISQDVSQYQINLGFSFDVPILGVVTVPISETGEFPLLKLPKLSLESIKLRSLSLAGAEIRLGVRLSNPNAFSMLLETLHYDLEVNGLQWIFGDAMEGAQITEKGESLIEIPMRLDLIELGRSVYQLLDSNDDLNFRFRGEIDLNTSLPILGKVNLPFDHSGKIKVIR